jgi:hypothetical protein
MRFFVNAGVDGDAYAVSRRRLARAPVEQMSLKVFEHC